MDIAELIVAAIGGGLLTEIVRIGGSALRVRAENTKTISDADKAEADAVESVARAGRVANESLIETVNQLKSDYAGLRKEYDELKKEFACSTASLTKRITELEHENCKLKRMLNERPQL